MTICERIEGLEVARRQMIEDGDKADLIDTVTDLLDYLYRKLEREAYF